MLSAQECMQLIAFLNRTPLEGKEAPTLTHLVNRLNQEGQAAQAAEQEAAQKATKPDNPPVDPKVEETTEAD